MMTTPYTRAQEAWLTRFDRVFWGTYPRKIAKRTAIKAWLQLMPRDLTHQAALANNILRTLNYRLRYDWADRDLQTIPYPATFLRAEDFSDPPREHEEREPLSEHEARAAFRALDGGK